MSFPVDKVPTTEAEWREALSDPMWRICSGVLYKIMIKENDDAAGGNVVSFKPNRAQLRLIRRLHYRNVILKARQLGFTTLVCILWLDHALFNAHQRVGIIAQDLEAAKKIFRDKVLFAYNNLPDAIRIMCPIEKRSADEILFAHNNSSIQVATSMRSGTIHRLHVSEMGKIGKKYPEKAHEVVTGSLPAVPLHGIAIIESTAEGRDGEFYTMCEKAKEVAQLGKPLSPIDFRLHFYPWWENPEYRLDPALVVISAVDHQYFDRVQASQGTTLDSAQRAWYVKTRDALFGGDHQRMYQEYPSTPDEPFLVSTEGTYYGDQLALARAEGRIGPLPVITGAPVNTFWDIGASDGTGIWLHQYLHPWHHLIGYIEGWGEPYSHFVRQLQATGYIWGRHYLPHDADHRRQQGDRVASPREMLEELAPGWTFEIVPRVDELQHGIQAVREIFSRLRFDEERCKEGLTHLAMYRREWNARVGGWKSTPVKDVHTEAADALRQLAQSIDRIAAPAMGRVRRRAGALAI